MTLGAAIRCNGGVVLCADSQESVGEFQYPVEKLRLRPTSFEVIGIVGSGRSGIADMIADELERSLEGGYDDIPSYKERVEDTLTRLYKDVLAVYPGTDEVRHVDTLVAVRPINLEYVGLFKCEANAVSNVQDFEIIGMGKVVRYEMQQLYRKKQMTMRQGVAAAIHILRTAGMSLHVVGGKSSIATITDDGRWALEPEWNVVETDRFMWNVRWRIGQLMLHVGDGTLSTDAFEEIMTEFSEAARTAHNGIIGSQEFMRRIEELANPQIKPSTSQSPEQAQ